jgi:hypothetical protein
LWAEILLKVVLNTINQPTNYYDIAKLNILTSNFIPSCLHKIPLQCYINGKIKTLKYYIRPFLSIRNYSILGAQVLHQIKKTQTVEQAQQLMRDSISSGAAMKKFKEMITFLFAGYFCNLL